MKKNLVIGSEGFIGKPFCKYLESKNEVVIKFDFKRSLEEDARYAKLPLDTVDLVYFLAWDVGGSKYLYKENIQKSQFDWNMRLMDNVFNQLEKNKIKFLFISSQLCEEADTVYGATKRIGEVWSKLLGGSCVRVWNAYGFMEEDNIKSHVISDFIFKALKTKRIDMLTDGEEWRQFTHINDLSSAFYLAANSTKLRRTVYDASSYEWVRVIDVASIISNLTGAQLNPGKIKGHDPLPAMNMGRVPNWLPSIELEIGIKEMINEAKKLLIK